MTRGTLSILHVCDEVGLGGTERGIVSMCRKMRYGVFEHAVLCLKRPGARADMLTGYAQLHMRQESGSAGALLSKLRPDVVIFHRAGDEHPRWDEILELLRPDAARIAVIEINIFGLVDGGPSDDVVDRHLHISKSSYCAFRRRAERSRYRRTDAHGVLYIPIELSSTGASSSQRDAARNALGIDAREFVFLRTGRPDVRKWGDLLLDALPQIANEVSEARFLFLSAPATRSWYMRRQWYGAKVSVLPPTTDDTAIEQAYRAADVYFHSSRRGESYGASLVEAMGMGLPIVVDSTPSRDNAQVEVVDHMLTGIVANSPAAFANAAIHLHRNPALRAQLGAQAREKAISTYDAEVVCRSLAGVIGRTLEGKGRELPAAPELRSPMIPDHEEIQRFWTSEEAARAQAGWEGVAPTRKPLFLRYPGWAMLDASEVVVRKLGLLR